MRRLARKTIYTQNNSLDTRVEMLERRIIQRGLLWAKRTDQDGNLSVTDGTIAQVVWDLDVPDTNDESGACFPWNTDITPEAENTDGILMLENSVLYVAATCQMAATGGAIASNGFSDMAVFLEESDGGDYGTIATNKGARRLNTSSAQRLLHHSGYIFSYQDKSTDPRETATIKVQIGNFTGADRTYSGCELVIVQIAPQVNLDEDTGGLGAFPDTSTSTFAPSGSFPNTAL